MSIAPFKSRPTLANSCFNALGCPICCTVSSNSSRVPAPASRKWLSNSSRISGSPTPPSAICRRHSAIASSSLNMLFLPQPRQNRVDLQPLFALLLMRFAAILFERIIFAFAAGFRFHPARFDPPLALEPVQHWIKHPVRPLQCALGAVLDLLD